MDNKQKQIKYNQQKYYKNKYKKTKAIKDIRIKISNDDIIAKIIDNITHRHNQFLKLHEIEINDLSLTSMELLGCNKEEFKEHILSKLKENMKLENYGEWEVDHIYPISKIDFSDTNDIIKYFNYKNLRPLDKIENAKKSNKII